MADPISPVKHLFLAWGTGNRTGDTLILQRICDHVFSSADIALVMPEYPAMQIRAPRASIRVCVSAGHQTAHLHRLSQALARAASDTFGDL